MSHLRTHSAESALPVIPAGSGMVSFANAGLAIMRYSKRRRSTAILCVKPAGGNAVLLDTAPSTSDAIAFICFTANTANTNYTIAVHH